MILEQDIVLIAVLRLILTMEMTGTNVRYAIENIIFYVMKVRKKMGVTLEYFLTKRITILKEMLERLSDDSEFNKGVRAAYKDELFMCENMYENIFAKHKAEDGITIDNHIEVLKSYHNGFTGCAGNLQDSIDVAIDIMRKYQEIQQIFKEPCIIPEGCYPMLKKIKGVLEDGKID